MFLLFFSLLSLYIFAALARNFRYSRCSRPRRSRKHLKISRTGTMPRKKIMIEKLDTERKIMVTYAKRRATVFKKAGQLCALHPGGQTRVAVITFSARGRPFVFGSPDVHSVVDAFLRLLDEPRRPPALPFPSGGDPALVAQSAAGSSKGKRKWEEDWLSLEGCDTLEALEAKRDEFVKVKAMIDDELKLNKAEAGETGVDWDLASTSAAPPPMVSTDNEQQCLSDLAAAGGAESSVEFVIGDDDVYVSLDAFFP